MEIEKIDKIEKIDPLIQEYEFLFSKNLDQQKLLKFLKKEKQLKIYLLVNFNNFEFSEYFENLLKKNFEIFDPKLEKIPN